MAPVVCGFNPAILTPRYAYKYQERDNTCSTSPIPEQQQTHKQNKQTNKQKLICQLDVCMIGILRHSKLPSTIEKIPHIW